ncbi:MAG: N-acetyltransferase [Oscillospiraceae bacterium]
MTQRVKEFSPQYLDQVGALHREVLEGWSLQGLKECLDSGLYRSFVTVDAEDIAVAFCAFTVVDVGELVFVCTHKNQRRKGIAYEMLKGALETLEEKTIVLEVRKENLGAQRLYEKLGFKIVGVRKSLYQNPTDDGIVMQLER